MVRRIKSTLYACGFLLAVFIGIAVIQGWFTDNDTSATLVLPPPPPDLSHHPLYSKYNFSKDERVIDFGIQPLWIPTGIITETMKRDLLLKKALDEYGQKINFHPFLKGADINFFLRRGILEAGIGGDMPTLTMAATGDVAIVSLAQLGFCSIVARGQMMVDELRGKRIGYAYGSNAHYALLQTLSLAGLNETDVQMVPLDIVKMPDALDKGEIDAFSAWEPTPTIAVTKYKGLRIIHKSLTTGFLHFSRSFAKRHPQAVNEVVAAQFRALRWLRHRHKNLLLASQWALQAGHDLSGQRPVLSKEQYATLAKNDLIGISSMATIPENDLAPGGRIDREFEFLKNIVKIPAMSDWDKAKSCFELDIAKRIVAQSSKYQLDKYEYRNSMN